MGGWAKALGRGVESLTRKGEEYAPLRGIQDLAGVQTWELQALDEGKIIQQYIEAGHRAKMGHLDTLNAPYKSLWEGIKTDPALSGQFDLAKTPLQDIHQHLQSIGHPLAAQSGQLMAQNASTYKGNTVLKNADKTLRELGYMNRRQASMLGQKQAMGQNYENVLPLIYRLASDPNPMKRIMAQKYADMISSEFRDTEMLSGRGAKGDPSGPESRTKASFNKAFRMINKSRVLEGEDPISLLNTHPVYTDQGVNERILTGLMRIVQVPFAFLPHSSMEVNLALRAPREALVKALFGVSKQDSDRILAASHSLALQDLDGLLNDIFGGTSKLAKWTKSPTTGSILNKVYHMPLFHSVRKMQIRHAGAVGFHSANYWAGRLMQGNKMAEAELKAMHLDPAEVRIEMMTRGQLNDAQLTKAVYHFADDTMFLNKGLTMPISSNANILTRSMNMYHFFIRNEVTFLAKTLSRMLQNGDNLGVARYIGTLLIAWPAISPFLISMENFLRTGSPQQAIDPIQKFYVPESPEEWISAYANGLAHFGALGTFMQYYDSVKNFSYWKQAVGSKISTPITYAQDVGAAAIGRSAKPLERDILQLVPLAGKPLSHMLVPTEKEEDSTYPGPTIRPRRRF